MAQRKKRAAARRAKVATRGKAAKPVRGKTARRTTAKAAQRKRVTKAKSKRAVAKKAVPTNAKRPKPPSRASVEIVIVDMIVEPVPDGVVVNEFEATGIRGPKANPEQPDKSRGVTPPESEER